MVHETLEIRCLVFGRYAELLGVTETTVELQTPATAADAVVALRRITENDAELPTRPLVAVNRRHVQLDHALTSGDEVAVLPPLAGG